MSFPSIKNNQTAHTLYLNEGGEEEATGRHLAALDKRAFQSKEVGNLIEEIRMERFTQLAPNYRIRIRLPFNNDTEFGCGINAKGRIFPKRSPMKRLKKQTTMPE